MQLISCHLYEIQFTMYYQQSKTDVQKYAVIFEQYNSIINISVKINQE